MQEIGNKKTKNRSEPSDPWQGLNTEIDIHFTLCNVSDLLTVLRKKHKHTNKKDINTRSKKKNSHEQ